MKKRGLITPLGSVPKTRMIEDGFIESEKELWLAGLSAIYAFVRWLRTRQNKAFDSNVTTHPSRFRDIALGRGHLTDRSHLEKA